jgi:23S rRNA (guanosine2251-2'-O)-methyltransferase
MIIYGKQVCLYALTHHEERIETLYVAKKHILPKALFHRYHAKIKFLEAKWAQSMSRGGNHQGILIEMKPLEMSSLSLMKRGEFLVILDGVTDTGNIGAIVRSAYALGADGVIASGVKSLNLSAIVRTSSGAMLDMPFYIEPNILDALNELKQMEFTLYGASMEGRRVEEVVFAKRRVLVMGSEGFGLSRRVEAKLDERVRIAMQHDFNSLNVSTAAGILIHRMGYAVK